MKKIFVLLFGLLAAGQVFAQTARTPCTGTGSGTDYVATAGNFVARGFPVRCSNNVFVATLENAIAFTAGAASSKGNNKFEGSTGGGAIRGQTCANPTVCINTDASSGLLALLALAT